MPQRIPDVYAGNIIGLLPYLPADGQVSWYLSGEPRCGEYADAAVVYGHSDDDESRDGNSVRTACGELALRTDGACQPQYDALYAPPCDSGDTNHSGDNHSYDRCLYAVYRGIADMAVV